MSVSNARGDTVKMLRELNEVMNLNELADIIDEYDEKDTFKNVVRRVFEDMFEEELSYLDELERREQIREDNWFESMRNDYQKAKDGE